MVAKKDDSRSKDKNTPGGKDALRTLRLKKGPDFALVMAAIRHLWLGDGCGSWQLAREADSFAAGTLGSLGLTGKPSGPGTDQVPALGLGSRVSAKEKGQ